MWPFVTSDFEFDSFARLREENQSSKTKKSAVVYKNRTIKQIVTDGGVAHTWEKYERYYFVCRSSFSHNLAISLSLSLAHPLTHSRHSSLNRTTMFSALPRK